MDNHASQLMMKAAELVAVQSERASTEAALGGMQIINAPNNPTTVSADTHMYQEIAVDNREETSAALQAAMA